MRKGIFTGSFDPFTIGHKDIVDRALPLFDELTILIGINETKHYDQPVAERIADISRIYANEPRIKVDSWSGLTVDYCSQHDIHFIVKGVRSVKDFEYERDQAEMNRHLSLQNIENPRKDLGNPSNDIGNPNGIETILLYSDPRLSAVSSSLVKLLKSYGRDVTEFLP